MTRWLLNERIKTTDTGIQIQLFEALKGLFRKPRASYEVAQLPWAGRTEEEMVAKLAIISLHHSLLNVLKNERGIHSETLMVAIGAIAGHAAAYAVWETMIKPGHLQLGRDIHTVEVKGSSDKFYFGNSINAFLVPEKPETLPLWNQIAGSAVATGVPAAELPDVREMFRHNADAVGTPAFGIVRAPDDHMPGWTAPQAINALWHFVKPILGRADNPGYAGYSVPVEQWPLVVAIVAGQYVTMAKDVLNPQLSVRFIMEAAIATSKMDPNSVLQVGPERSA